MYIKSIGRILPLFFLVINATGVAKNQKTLPHARIQFTHQKKITERDAIDKAFMHRKDLRAFENIRAQNKINERAALSAYVPQAQVRVEKAKSAPPTLVHPETLFQQFCPETTTASGISFTMQQLLFSGGKPLLDYKIAKEGTLLVELDREAAEKNIQISVERAFLELQRLHWKNNLIETQNKTAKTVFFQRGCQNIVGFLSPSEWQKAAAEYASQQSEVFNYDRNKTTALTTLQRQMNAAVKPDQIDFSLSNVQHIKLEPLEFYLKKALVYRPDLQKFKHAIKQAKYAEKRAARNYIPDFRLYAEAFEDKLKIWEVSRTSRWQVGLRVDFSFDGLASAHSSLQQAELADQYHFQKKDLELQIETNVKNTYEQIKILQNNLTKQLFTAKQQETNLLQQEKKFEVGLISKATFSQAQQSYQQARFDLISSQIDIKLAYENLLFLCGYPKGVGTSHRVVT